MNVMTRCLIGATICGSMLLSPASDAEESKPTDPLKGRNMTAENADLEYGFRYDPMVWLRDSRSVPAAQVRTFLLRRPAPGDDAILRGEIERILAEQGEEGDLGGKETVGKLIRLKRLGCSPDREEVQRAVAYVSRPDQLKDDGSLGVYRMHIVTWANWTDKALIRKSAAALVDEVASMNFYSLCPWGGQVHTHAMWAGRDYADVTSALERGLKVMLDGLQSSGWPVYLDPIGFLDAAGHIDHPLARKIVVKQLPLILRSQRPDGSWGGMKHLGYGPDDTTYIVLRALIKWKLLEPLRQRPAMPPEWRVVRCIPAPKGDLERLTFDGKHLWLCDTSAGEAVALSPADGTEAHRARLPAGELRNLGRLKDGRVAVSLRPAGEENDALWAFAPEAESSWVRVAGKQWQQHTAGGWICHDFWGGPTVLIQRPEHPLHHDVENGVAPFGNETTGVVFDGKHLWALDNGTKRLCVIEKVASAGEIPVDYSKLSYKGSGHTQDSFSLAVVAAAGLLGREVDFRTVCAYSSNPFAPAIDRGENCTAWWHVNGAQGDRCMGTVAAALGLRAEQLDLPPDGITGEDPPDVFEQKASAHRKVAAGSVRKEMESGGVLITAGLWKTKTKDGFAPWHWWGIVTGATDDGDLRGACLGAHPGKPTGFRDRPIDFLGSRWVLRLGDVTMDHPQAIRTTLQQAVDRIRGRGRFKAEDRFIYGLEAMDAWITQMKTVPFCEACAHAGAKGMAGCAVNNRDTTSSGAAVAASYLRSIATACPETARPALRDAAEHYDRIGKLLAPATWQAYREMLNDGGKQEAHAADVLVPVKAELSAAADAMEKALAAIGNAATAQ